MTSVLLQGITRRFPGVLAVDDLTLDLQGGSVYALVGSNGAGKSTVIKMLSGLLRPDAGSILIDGRPTRLRNARVAAAQGIVTVHQEAEYFPTLSVAENIALITDYAHQTGWIHSARTAAAARPFLEQWAHPPSPYAAATTLSVAERQLLQVATAIAKAPRMLILDEPTASLSQSECDWLFKKIDQLRAAGTAVLYVSHRLDEVLRLADYVTVMRDGAVIWTRPVAEASRQEMIAAMVGDATATTVAERSQPEPRVKPEPCATPAGKQLAPLPAQSTSLEPLLVVRDLSDDADQAGVSLSVFAGEVVAIYGLIGSGRSEFVQLLYGMRRARRGEVTLHQRTMRIRSPRDAMREGICYLPEDRLSQAVFPTRSIRDNTVISTLDQLSPSRRLGPWSLIHRGRESAATMKVLDQFRVRYHDPSQAMLGLSGGNQQKVVLGRCMLARPAVFLLDEPTRGVDIRAKDDMHAALRELASEGAAVIMITSELSEAMEYSDRVIVFRQGRVAAEFDPRDSTAAEITDAAFPETSLHYRDAGPCAAAADSTVATRRQSRLGWRHLTTDLALAVTVLCMVAILQFSSDGFRLLSVADAAATWVLLSLAAMCVIVVGGIDISIGSILALSAVTAAFVLRVPWPPQLIVPLAVIAAVGVGGAAGFANAWVSLVGRVHPIVVTLGTMTIYRGMVITLLGRNAMTGLPKEFGALAIHPSTGFRTSVLTATVVALLAHLWLAHTRRGRRLYAVGSNPIAARMAGISPEKTWWLAFAVSGALVGLAGVLQLASSMQMQGRLAQGWELVAIAAAVIGGVSITGGRGTVLGVVLAAVLLRLTNSVLVHWGIADHHVDLMIGSMLVLAILIDRGWKAGSGGRRRE